MNKLTSKALTLKKIKHDFSYFLQWIWTTESTSYQQQEAAQSENLAVSLLIFITGFGDRFLCVALSI